MMEVKIKCLKNFELKTLKGESTGIVIKKNKTGVALKHLLKNGESFYTCEVDWHYFDLNQKQFEEYMIEKQ